MKLEITKELRFIPEFNGNKDFPDTDKVTVSLRNPTIQIKNRCRSNPETVAKADPSGKVQDINITIKSDDNAVLNEMLLSISNLSYEDDKGNEVKIVNAKDLNVAPIQFDALRKEIVDECNRILDNPQVNEKN